MSVVKPGLPAALVKCLYLLVCLPARKERAAVEETFQELLIQVSPLVYFSGILKVREAGQ